MNGRPSPCRPDDHEYWLVSEAASSLTKQACTLSGRHINDGMLRMQFNRELAYYAKRVVDDVATGRRTPEDALREMKDEQSSLVSQGFEVAKKGAGAIAGALQIATGASICYGSAGLLCVVAGAPLIAHGANNIYENGQNLLTGRNDAQGPVRKGYQAAASAMGGSIHDGNIAYGTADIGLSLYSLGRLVKKPGAWRLFRYVRSDYVRTYQQMGGTALSLEIYIDADTAYNIYLEKRN